MAFSLRVGPDLVEGRLSGGIRRWSAGPDSRHFHENSGQGPRGHVLCSDMGGCLEIHGAQCRSQNTDCSSVFGRGTKSDMLPQRSLLLGDLEQAVMVRLWSGGPQDVKACHLAIGRSRRITHNTVQSTMERLYRKGLLRRDKVSHAYVYEAVLSREEYGAQLARDVVAAAVGSATPTSLLAAFVDLAERTGDEGLARLERLIAERRTAAKERA